MLARAGGLPLRGARDPQEAGETLVEMLVTVILMGVGAIAILSSLLTSSATAHSNRQKTEVSVYLQSWAERTASPLTASGAINWRNCVEMPGVQPSLASYTGWTSSVKLEHLVTPVTNWSNPSFTPVTGSCNEAVDVQMVRITLTVATAPGRNKVTDSVVVYHRNPKCPDPANNPDQGPC